MSKGNSIFTAVDLTVGYAGHSPLFDRLNLSLVAGQLVCLMGPNGAGKSTLIRTLAGLQPALGGSLSHRDEKHLAVVLTDKVSSGHMSAAELIAYGRYPHIDWSISLTSTDQAAIDKVVSLVQIDNLLVRKLYELSDGQLQMVMIARALVQETPVLLLDEPTAHLDLNNRVAIMNLLRQLSRESGKAILVSTHELDLALQTADRIWLASRGSIKQGIPEDLVLNGSFDEVFQFKGFDLKTGRVQHVPFRKFSVQLSGEGATMLWTKNALERNGFEVSDQGKMRVQVSDRQWSIDDREFSSLEQVIDFLLTR